MKTYHKLIDDVYYTPHGAFRQETANRRSYSVEQTDNKDFSFSWLILGFSNYGTVFGLYLRIF